MAIARTLVHAPVLVLCDAPTSNLDPARAAGTIAILVIHSLAAAAAPCA